MTKKLQQKDVQNLGPGNIRKVPQEDIDRIYHEETSLWLKKLAAKNRKKMGVELR